MNFLKALIVFIHMWQDGFYLGESTHKDKDGTRWGFYCFSHQCRAQMFDIDYSFDGKHNYFHVHGDDYRADFDYKNNRWNMVETIMKNEHEARIWWTSKD
jgi:hypothetical protein